MPFVRQEVPCAPDAPRWERPSLKSFGAWKTQLRRVLVNLVWVLGPVTVEVPQTVPASGAQAQLPGRSKYNAKGKHRKNERGCSLSTSLARLSTTKKLPKESLRLKTSCCVTSNSDKRGFLVRWIWVTTSQNWIVERVFWTSNRSENHRFKV